LEVIAAKQKRELTMATVKIDDILIEERQVPHVI
jgi:hypothetical protein